MNLDEIHNIEIFRTYLKKVMIKLLVTIETPTKIYNANEWYFYTCDEKGYFLYLDDPSVGLEISYEEADEYLDIWR